MNLTRRHLLAVATAVFSLSGVALWPRDHVAADTLPKQLSDRTFWKLVVDISEPGGFFRSDNLISNETTFQQPIPELQKRSSPDGVYLGVGPDQNFTYITALRPRMAFIIDIRRQNMLLHLMYKALIETSTDRADFLSRLFSRPRPADLDKSSTARQLLDAFSRRRRTRRCSRRTCRRSWIVWSSGTDFRCRTTTGAASSSSTRRSTPRDRTSATRSRAAVRRALVPDLRRADGADRPQRAQPQLHVREESFRVLRDFQRNNLIVPVVGDFGGEKAIRAVGSYLREHDATVTTSTRRTSSSICSRATPGRSSSRTSPRCRSTSTARSSAPISTWAFAIRRASSRRTALGAAARSDPRPADAFRGGELHTYYDVVERSK